MRKMRKSAMDVRSPRTFGELVALAFDICPSRAAAVKLVGQLLRGGVIQMGAGSSQTN